MTIIDKIHATVSLVSAVADAVRELGEVPSGLLYARFMGKMSLENYNIVLGILTRTGLIQVDQSHLIRWTGPAKEA